MGTASSSTTSSPPAAAGSSRSLGERIVRAGMVVAFAHVLLKFAGLVQVRFATQYLPVDVYEPVMVVAFSGVLNSLFLIGEEVIGPSFLTLFMQEREKRGEAAAWRYADSVLGLQAVVLLAVVSSIVCFPDLYISLFTSWTPGADRERYRLLRTALRTLAPALWFLSMGSTTYVLLNGYKRFFLAAFGDAVTKICIVLGLVVGMRILGFGVGALFFGILCGSAGKLATHLWGLRGHLRSIALSGRWRTPAMRAMYWLMLPLLAGIVFAKVRDVFNNVYILTRIDQEGILMANDLGRKLFASIQWLVPYALQIALFPFLCELVSRDDRRRLGDVLETSCRMLVAVFLPMSVCLAVLAKPLAVLIFAGGRTGVGLAALSGVSMACYTLVLPAAAVECVLMQGYFADRRTVAVTLIGIASSLLSVLVSFLAIVVWRVTPLQALLAVSLGFVLSRTVKSLALASYLKRSVPMFPIGDTLLFLARCLLLAALAGGAAWAVSGAWSRLVADGIAESLAGDAAALSRIRILLRLAVAGAAGAAVFLLGARLLRISEVAEIIRWTAARLPGGKTHHDPECS